MAAEDPTPPDAAPDAAPEPAPAGAAGHAAGRRVGGNAAGVAGGPATGDGDLHAHLLDEPTTADLRAKVTEAWREFARALAATLPGLPSGGRLELTLDPTASGTGDAEYAVTLELEPGGEII